MPINVILADDHTLFRQGLAALLQTVEEIELLAQAANRREAWDLIERLQPEVAILDICMPELTGIEVARQTSMAGFATQVVLLTACEDPLVAIEAQQAGAAGYVLKDSSFEELVIAVQTVAAGGTFVTSTIRAKLRELQRHGRTITALSPREREVMRLIALGKTGKEIAQLMEISPRTVATYRDRLMDKLQAHTVADVVRYAVRVAMVA
jgi:DNA-binding NarL/FixJ family response regulator